MIAKEKLKVAKDLADFISDVYDGLLVKCYHDAFLDYDFLRYPKKSFSQKFSGSIFLYSYELENSSLSSYRKLLNSGLLLYEKLLLGDEEEFKKLESRIKEEIFESELRPTIINEINPDEIKIEKAKLSSPYFFVRFLLSCGENGVVEKVHKIKNPQAIKKIIEKNKYYTLYDIFLYSFLDVWKIKFRRFTYEVYFKIVHYMEFCDAF